MCMRGMARTATTGQKTTGHKTTGQKTTGHKTTGQKTTRHKTTGQKTTGRKPRVGKAAAWQQSRKLVALVLKRIVMRHTEHCTRAYGRSRRVEKEV